jgi:hypothetical protein
MPEGWKPGGQQGPAPDLWPGAEPIWEAWQALFLSRPVGWGMGAIPVSEVFAYCNLLGIADLNQREWILRAIQRLDSEFLKFYSDEAKKK